MSDNGTQFGKRKFGLIFAGFSLIFIAIGATLAILQGHRMQTYRPTDATILDGHVESRSDSDGTTYSPLIHYTYFAGGQNQTGSDVTMFSYSAGYNWANEILRRYPPGMKTTAYYNPAKPASAFLLREVSFFPYLFILFPMLHFTIGLGMFVANPAAGDDSAKSNRYRGLVICTITWITVGAISAAHYFYLGGQADMMATIALSIYGAIAAGLLIAMMRTAPAL